MSKHNHSYIQPSTGTYISGIFFKTKNCPFSISKTTDKSNKNKTTLIFFPPRKLHTCYICLWHEILLENDI